MQPYSENQNLVNKKWRAISYDWDTISVYGNQGKLYCLTDFQAAWLQANVPYIAWSTRWENCPCTDEDLSQFASELEYALMACIDIQPWQLDYLYNQGITDTLATFNNDWDGMNPSSINPDSPDDFYSGDGSLERNEALCLACKLYVYSYLQNWKAQVEAILGIAVVAGFLVSIAPFGGLIAVTIVSGLLLAAQNYLNAITDEDAVDEVICCMYNNLLGQAIGATAFENSLLGCAFTPLSNEELIREILQSDIQNFDNLLAFYNTLGQAYTYTSQGISDCPCNVEVTYYLELDLTVTQGNTTVDSGQSVWTLGVGYTEVDAGSISRCYVDMELLSEYRFIRTEMRFSKTAVTGNGFNGFRWLQGGVVQSDDLSGGGAAFPYPSTKQSNLDISGIDEIGFRVNSSGGNSPMLIDRLRIAVVSAAPPLEFTNQGWVTYIP